MARIRKPTERSPVIRRAVLRVAVATGVCAGTGWSAETVLPRAAPAGGTAMNPMIEREEVVTDQAVVGDGGNNWGGHQTRIVRTKDGIFTAYTTGKSDPPGAAWRAYDGSPRSWKIAMRTDQGWPVLAEGPSGREPVNLMASPDGRLHVIAWPGGLPHLWTGTFRAGKLAVKDEAIPGPWVQNDWPYNAAGISTNGHLALLQSITTDAPGRFVWGYRAAGTHRWLTGTIDAPHRHCYSYVFPTSGGGLSFTSTRDVLWTTIGDPKSATGHSLGYVFNRVGCWWTDDVATKPFADLTVAEAVPSKEYPEVAACNTCVDSYVDTRGRLHALYFLLGPETKGKQVLRHSVVEKGKVVKAVELPEELNGCFAGPTEKPENKPKYCRIIQDAAGRFYLLGTAAIVPADSEDGTTPGKPVPLKLKDFTVEYSGIAVAAPRGGTPLADIVDGVFPTAAGRKVIYLRIRLR